MRLLNKDGSPCGINFRKQKQTNAYVIRVQGNGNATDFGVTPDNVTQTYQNAVDKRLDYLGVRDNADARQTLERAYLCFLARYKIGFKDVMHIEFDIQGE